MMAPTMTTEAKPAMPEDLARDLACAEVLAVRLEAQVTLIALANQSDGTVGIGDYALDHAIDGAIKLSLRLREKLQCALAGLDSPLADADVTDEEIEDDGEDSA